MYFEGFALDCSLTRKQINGYKWKLRKINIGPYRDFDKWKLKVKDHSENDKCSSTSTSRYYYAIRQDKLL